MAQADLVPLLSLRQHERFRGPFRAWLAVTDALRFGLPGLVRRVLNHTPERQNTLLEPLLAHGQSSAEDLLRAEAQGVQSLLYAQGLPIERWRTVTVQAEGRRLMAEVATALKSRFETAAAASVGRGGATVWLINVLGHVVPAVFVVIGSTSWGATCCSGTISGCRFSAISWPCSS